MPMYTAVIVARAFRLVDPRDIRAQLIQVDREQQTTHVRDLEGWIRRRIRSQRLVRCPVASSRFLPCCRGAGLYSVVTYTVATHQ